MMIELFILSIFLNGTPNRKFNKAVLTHFESIAVTETNRSFYELAIGAQQEQYILASPPTEIVVYRAIGYPNVLESGVECPSGAMTHSSYVS